MGGSSYNIGVGRASYGRTHSKQASEAYSRVKTAHPDVIPSGDRRVYTDAKNPIVIALDVTGSMGESAKIMFDKMPMFWGQIEQKGYLEDPSVCFVAIGDAYTDEAPLQITQFEKGKAIHSWLEKIWLEGGGGGQTMESYDLAALFFITKCSTPNMEQGFFFFICDEGYYPELDGKSTVPLFEELKNRFTTFVIHWPYSCGADEDDERIVSDWRHIFGEHVIILRDPKAIVDVMLGLIAIQTGARNIGSYMADMKERGQTDERVSTVEDALRSTSKALIKQTDSVVTFKNRDPFRSRKVI